MANKVDFDALARKANESGSAIEDLNRLFGAAFALPVWHFVARGELPDIHPYVASKADFDGGRNMVRAFTDTNRLQRFAKENNLTAPDGSVKMLNVPTDKIIDYLEGFIENGVHGIWFNSDRESDGFFLPLKQLRPTKEYLEKLNRQLSGDSRADGDVASKPVFIPPINSQNSGERRKVPLETVIVVVKDGLMLPSGFVKQATYDCVFYCRVPPSWTEGGDLKAAYLEKIYEKVYGATWRAGNDDGSRYVVQKSYSNVVKPEAMKNVDWTGSPNSEKEHFFYYIAGENGEVRNVTPQEFQKDVDASPQISAPPAPQKSNLENWGFSRSPDGGIEQIYVTPDGETYSPVRATQKSNLEKWGVFTSSGATAADVKFFTPGGVKFETSILPFYATIAPLLKEYQGSGEFSQIFSFAPEAVKYLTENITTNRHGEYFRLRRFEYHKSNVIADAATIDSNQMRHVQTGATLSLSFVLLKVPGMPTAAFDFGMQGNRAEVERLLNAVVPLLEAADFVADESRK